MEEYYYVPGNSEYELQKVDADLKLLMNSNPRR